VRLLVASLLAGLAAAAVAALVVPPTRRAGPRIDPYARRARLLLGSVIDSSLPDPPAPAGDQGVLGPLVEGIAWWLSGRLDGGEDAIGRRCRHAGLRGVTPDQYRLRQLGSTAAGGAAGAMIGLVAMPSGGVVLVGTAVGLVFGISRWRARLDRATARRRERMRAELYTVAHLLAIHVRAGVALLVAVEGVTRASSGPVAEELGDALDSIRDGTPARAAFERLAADTAEPAAARLYRLLATGDIGAGEALADALRHAANDLRTQRREDLERLAVQRRFQMLVPIIFVMAPVVLLYIAAPIPSLIFGAP
jgi:tight adherence protein C